MMMKVSKIGIILSLAMVTHALFYPNKFSLIIAIIGYIIALASAVAYGLCKFSTNSQKVPQENMVEEQIAGLTENIVNTIPKMSFYIPKSDYRMPIISASKLSNDYPKNLIDKIILENPNLNSNDLETIREIEDIGLAERNKESLSKKIIPGYQ
jgi:hypothetical protein